MHLSILSQGFYYKNNILSRPQPVYRPIVETLVSSERDLKRVAISHQSSKRIWPSRESNLRPPVRKSCTLPILLQGICAEFPVVILWNGFNLFYIVYPLPSVILLAWERPVLLSLRCKSFLAPLAVGQRAYVMVRCPSCVRPSVRALTFSLNIFFSETTYRIFMKFHRNFPAIVLFRISWKKLIPSKIVVTMATKLKKKNENFENLLVRNHEG